MSDQSLQNETCNSWKIPEAFVGKPEELFAALELNLACNNKEFTELCLTQSSRESSIAVRLLALSFLSSQASQSSCDGSKLSDDLRDKIKARRSQVFEELSHQLPTDMSFPLIVILDQLPEKNGFPLTDIEYIEGAVSRPRLSPSLEELYADYLTRFTTVGGKNPYLSASSMAFSVDSFPILSLADLKKRMKITAESASPEVRQRLAGIMEKLGRAQIKRNTLMELMFGITTLRSSAELRNDKLREERLKGVYQHLRKFFDTRIIDAVTSSRLWPIRPLIINATEMQIKNEIRVYQQFADTDIPDDLLRLYNAP